jgi:hypothetical protein
LLSSTPLLLAVPRIYHAVAILLPDGSVLVCGGDDTPNLPSLIAHNSGQIYMPAYMFSSTRPQMTPPLSVIKYLSEGAQSFDMDVVTDPSVSASQLKVVLISAGSVTHGFDRGQRYMELDIIATPAGDPGAWLLQVTPPNDPTEMPPGMYMMFTVAAGIPSVASIVRLC